MVPTDGDLEVVKPSKPELDYDSICDDLSFCMYVEESVAEVIREMETLKHKAVKGKLSFTCYYVLLSQIVF